MPSGMNLLPIGRAVGELGKLGKAALGARKERVEEREPLEFERNREEPFNPENPEHVLELAEHSMRNPRNAVLFRKVWLSLFRMKPEALKEFFGRFVDEQENLHPFAKALYENYLMHQGRPLGRMLGGEFAEIDAHFAEVRRRN
jgi:hypothetical protein